MDDDKNDKNDLTDLNDISEFQHDESGDNSDFEEDTADFEEGTRSFDPSQIFNLEEAADEFSLAEDEDLDDDSDGNTLNEMTEEEVTSLFEMDKADFSDDETADHSSEEKTNIFTPGADALNALGEETSTGEIDEGTSQWETPGDNTLENVLLDDESVRESLEISDLHTIDERAQSPSSDLSGDQSTDNNSFC